MVENFLRFGTASVPPSRFERCNVHIYSSYLRALGCIETRMETIESLLYCNKGIELSWSFTNAVTSVGSGKTKNAYNRLLVEKGCMLW